MTALAHDIASSDDASAPPEARGLARDEVRMLVATGGPVPTVAHRRAVDLPSMLHPGDLLVLNTSATLPSAVPLAGERVVHVSTELDDGDWVVEVRRPDNTGPDRVTAGESLSLPGGVRLRVVCPHPAGQSRLWRATPHPAVARADYLGEHGRPVRYSHIVGDWPLDAWQNVYASVPGSAEMPSAGRPLSERLLVRLVARGVVVAPLVLHTGVSSAEAHEPPQPEQYVVPAATARLVGSTRRAGRRVVAVGTTVVRALETVADRRGGVHAAAGWTPLVLGPHRPARVVDGLLTGLHAAGTTHLDLLRAVAGEPLVERAYHEVTHGPTRYLWHEFGDAMLLLP